MRQIIKFSYLVLVMNCLATQVLAAGMEDIVNYRQYNDSFSSSGQPTTEQIPLLASEGFQRVIYLALTNNHTAIPAEDDLVLKNGMEYIHIPVDFERPSLKNFQLAAMILNNDPALKTLLHCQINLRASAFSFLYRVVFLKVPMSDAKETLDSVWVPDPVWFKFIVDTLAHYKLSADCEGCDWGERDFDES